MNWTYCGCDVLINSFAIVRTSGQPVHLNGLTASIVKHWLDCLTTPGLFYMGNEMTNSNDFINLVIEKLNKEEKDFELFQFLISFINCLADAIHDLNSKWWKDLRTGEPDEHTIPYLLSKVALMHTELSEACEGILKGIKDDHLPNRDMEEVELADTIIRILDYAAARDLDIGGAIIEKCLYNMKRADHQVENRLAEGGKKA